MQVTQSYAQPSSATFAPDGMRLSVAAELSRPPVSLNALVKDSLAYARVMLALYSVVSGDHRAKQKDHTAYQEWVQQRYLEELTTEMASRVRVMPALIDQENSLRERIKEIRKAVRPLEEKLASKDFLLARGQYFKWLWENAKEMWMALDPVVSVHPDCVVFEVFSIDESSYGRVTVPMDRLDLLSQPVFGTTNVDYSKALADEIARVRDYRPAFLQVEAGGVTVGTGAGERMEKKIDLPPTWVRGFLQVQSASAFSGIDVTLSADTVAEVLAVLQRRREDAGPRSLRFKLEPGKKPVIVVEPWNVEIAETQHVYTGDHTGDVRIWGRRRLLVLASLMPYAEKVQARLLGTGMPSYWTVFQKDHRFDLGLSGWTKNDWSRAARFDLLASTGTISEGDIEQAARALEGRLRLTPDELSAQTDLSREAATAALQRLCREGRAMFDLAAGVYRWRQLLPFPVHLEEDNDPRVALARRLVATGGVKWLKAGEDEDESSFGIPQAEKTTRFRAQVRGGEEKRERKFHVILDLDEDGRARFVQCNCSWHRREKLRKGPCAHILAATVLASQQQVGAAAASAPSGGAGGFRPDRFKGQNFVFTGALTIFTREQAEALVAQGGGKASGSVSRNTTYLVAGDKAGSKLTKARELGVPVITEAQFQAMLEDRAI
jgi:hypothetical protein